MNFVKLNAIFYCFKDKAKKNNFHLRMFNIFQNGNWNRNKVERKNLMQICYNNKKGNTNTHSEQTLRKRDR